MGYSPWGRKRLDSPSSSCEPTWIKSNTVLLHSVALEGVGGEGGGRWEGDRDGEHM